MDSGLCTVCILCVVVSYCPSVLAAASQITQPRSICEPFGSQYFCRWGMVIPTLWPLLQRMGSEETCPGQHHPVIEILRGYDVARYFGLVIGTFSLTRVICQPWPVCSGVLLDGVLAESWPQS